MHIVVVIIMGAIYKSYGGLFKVESNEKSQSKKRKVGHDTYTSGALSWIKVSKH